jgi:hypothetical protein
VSAGEGAGPGNFSAAACGAVCSAGDGSAVFPARDRAAVFPGRGAGAAGVSCRNEDVAVRAVQRSVHPRMSRQYQRTSEQPGPPSAISRSVGSRIPHSQQDSTTVSPREPGVSPAMGARRL